jgi:ABC-type ATPase with predicted acetyltransferase domain
MSMITLKHLERFYPLAKGKFFYVLRDINLEVNEGDFVSIMGPSCAASLMPNWKPVFRGKRRSRTLVFNEIRTEKSALS